MSSFQCLIFWQGESGRIENGKYQLLKTDRSDYIVILLKLQKGLELVSNPQHLDKNMLEMFVMRYNSMWPNFTSIVFKIQKKQAKA